MSIGKIPSEYFVLLKYSHLPFSLASSFEAFNRYSSSLSDPETLKNYLSGMSEESLIGVASNVKGILHEIQFAAIENNNFTNKQNSIGSIYIVRDPRNVITSIQNHYELNIDEALKFMLSENKYIYDYHKKNDYSDFQFISSWEKNYRSWKNQKNFPVKII